MRAPAFATVLALAAGCGPAPVAPGSCRLEPTRIGGWPPEEANAHASRGLRVYWDVSGGMKHHADALGAVLVALQSAGLSAGVEGTADHRLIGPTVRQVAGPHLAQSLKHPAEPWSAIHLAATEAGTDLGTGEIGAALFVSDMNVEVATAQRAQTSSVCGAPTPVLPEAGALFGRCLQDGLSTSSPAAGAEASAAWYSAVLAPDESVPPPATGVDPLFILVLAANWDLGRRITQQLSENLRGEQPETPEFSATVLADWGTAGLQPPDHCSWGPEPLRGVRPSGVSDACSFLCDGSARLRLDCQASSRPAERATALPETGLVRMDFGPLNVAPAGRVRAVRLPQGDPGRIELEAACGLGPLDGKTVFDLELSGEFSWSRASFSPGGGPNSKNVQDLFDSLLELLQTHAPSRSWSVRIPIDDP